jgi:hypothetical protein
MTTIVRASFLQLFAKSYLQNFFPLAHYMPEDSGTYIKLRLNFKNQTLQKK